jgi:hypothetical protein
MGEHMILNFFSLNVDNMNEMRMTTIWRIVPTWAVLWEASTDTNVQHLQVLYIILQHSWVS